MENQVIYKEQMSLKGKLQVICLLIAFLTSALSQSTPAMIELQGLKVNQLALTNLNQSQSQIYIHNFDQQFQSKPQLALGVVALEQTGALLDTSFHVMPQSVTQTGMTLSWSRNLQKWVKIVVKYIASTRSDLILNYKQIIVTPSTNTTTTPLTINTDSIPNYDTSILRTFLLGCDSISASVECGLLPKSVGSSSIIIDIYAPKAPNVTFTFSYLIFSPSTAAFTSYGGYLTNQSFQGSFVSSVHKSIAFTPYLFYGLSYLNYSTQQDVKIAAEIDDELVFKIGSQSLLDRYALFHIIIGKTAKNACTQSSSYQFLSKCLPSCPDNTTVFSYTDGGKACRSCSAALNLTFVNGTCVTSNISSRSDMLSAILGLFRQTANRTIEVSQSSASVNTQSITSSRSLTSSTSSSSSATSSTSSSTQNVGNDQSLQQSQVTAQKAVSTYYDTATTQTQGSASATANNVQASSYTSPTYETQPNTDYSSNTAVPTSLVQSQPAVPQYYTTTQTTTSCAQNQYLINGRCACQVGYDIVNGYCAPISTSQAELLPLAFDNSAGTLDQSYIQPQTYVQPSLITQPSSQLPIDCGEGFDNGLGVCVCSAGLQFSQGRCIYVGQNEVNQMQAVSVSPVVCGANMIFDQISQKCRCLSNFIMLDGVCIQRQYYGDLKNQTQSNITQQNQTSTQILTQSNRSIDTVNKTVNNTEVCGNGVIEGKEQCDDKNVLDDDGCSSTCKIQKGYTCQSSPSVCSLIPNSTVNSNQLNSTSQNITKQNQTQNSTTPASLQLFGEIKANNNQIFMTMDAITEFNFPDQESMKNFLKAKFVGCQPPTVFCSQQASKKNLFDCLFLFPSGIPNKPFTTNFSYSYQSKSGSCSVPVDPLKCQLSQTLARTNAKSTTLTRVT